MASPAIKLGSVVRTEASKPVKVKASVRANMIARYHRLVDLELAQKLTVAQAEELKSLNATFDAWDAPEIRALERHYNRKFADADRLLAEIQKARIDLANASRGQKPKTAGS